MQKTPISGNAASRSKSIIETVMWVIFLVCGLITVVTVVFISLYMIISGVPAISKIGLVDFLLGQTWYPDSGEYGILAMILSSLIATSLSILIAVPIGVLVAVFLSYIVSERIAGIFRSIIELLSGIPSVVYGLLGAILIVPMTFRLQEAMGLPYSGSLLAVIAVLVIMILPTIISISENAIRSVPRHIYASSLALGGSKMQSIFRSVIPAAKSGIVAGMVLGIGRAIGETMAVMMVAGNSAIMPHLLKPVRLLTVGIPMEWSYSSGLHREALCSIGLVLFIFIMIINVVLNRILKGGNRHAK